MLIDIIVPSAGESITQVELARWLATDGSMVEKDQEIAEIDSDKATLTINAPQAGTLRILVDEGSVIPPGKVIGHIDISSRSPQEAVPAEEMSPQPQLPKSPKSETVASGIPQSVEPLWQASEVLGQPITFSPQAKKLLGEEGLENMVQGLMASSRRITKKDVLEAISAQYQANPKPEVNVHGASFEWWSGGREETRKKMSLLRKKVAERLVSVKNQTAMLTSFNEVDMTAILKMRENYKQAFQEKYGVKLGLMAFFAKALTEAITWFPQVNGRIEDNHLVIPRYADVGIAVSTPKGLMVPVIRNAESLSFAETELKIAELAEKARSNKISIEELSGGTISITNGGVFGSMLSTPILNPPQSAILGMHQIMDRPVALQGKVEIRPMMYLALTYDHRIIDGRESVGFLIKIKEMLENPDRISHRGLDPAASLLGLA